MLLERRASIVANSNQGKVFLIFVEGSTDADCLDIIVEGFKQKLVLSDITIRIQNGDIFTSTENKTKNGQTILEDQIQLYLNYSKLSPDQIIHVAFVTDTDGIYINQINYLVTPSIDSWCYDFSNGKVLFKDSDKKRDIIASRQTKAKKVSQVIKKQSESTLEINGTQLSYSVYFNSVNLEHVLFEKVLPDEEKTEAIDKLLDEIDDDPNKMIAIFESKALGTSYMDSWDQIQKLEVKMKCSYTNLHILFKLLESFKNIEQV